MFCCQADCAFSIAGNKYVLFITSVMQQKCQLLVFCAVIAYLLLNKRAHYCWISGEGFKRQANQRLLNPALPVWLSCCSAGHSLKTLKHLFVSP